MARRLAVRGLIFGLFSCCALCAMAFQEAPMLAERVEQGLLAPVQERLPEEPLVVEPIESIGRYGGIWRRVVVGPFDMMLGARMGYEPVVRWDRTGKHVVPGLAQSWEIEDEGRTYVLHLRRGLRWSDGVEFTSEAFRFAYEEFLLNKELVPVFPGWLTIDGTPAVIQTPDKHTVVFHFEKPYGIFLELLAFRGGQGAVYLPSHYLKQFHINHADKSAIQELLKEAGFELWYQLFARRASLNENPDLPTMGPFQLKTKPPAQRVIAERNPFYWKVDPVGNQLPYIDQVAFAQVQNIESANFKALTGDVDYQARYMNPANYSLFMQNRAKGGYRVQADVNPCSLVIYVNQCSKDLQLRPLLQDRRFRIALSVAINRKELIDLVYSGMAEPARGVASPFDPYYLPEYDSKYLEYDPELANRLLDELGLKRTSAGMRRMPDGKPFRQILNIYPSEMGTSFDLWELVADYWREVGLDFVTKTDAKTLSVLQVQNGNSDFWAYSIAGLHWVIDPLWYIPWYKSSYFAPLFGQYQDSSGKAGEKPLPEYQRLIDWYLELRSVVGDDALKLELGRKILGQWAEECYTIGICRDQLITIVSNRFRNVPKEIIHDYRVLTPGYIGIEQFYMEQ